MASNLQVEQALSATAQPVKDQFDNTSPISLSTDRVIIGNKDPNAMAESFFMVGQLGSGPNNLLTLARRAEAENVSQIVTFSLDPTGRVFHIDVGGNKNSGARIHLGDIEFNHNPVTTLGNVGIGTTSPGNALHIRSADLDATGVSNARIVIENGLGNKWFLNTFSSEDKFSIGRVAARKNDLVIDGSGNVRIREKLEVNGNIHGNQNIICAGDVQLSGADCAEEFRIEESSQTEPGTVMVIGDEDTLQHCTEAYDRRVAGIISGAGDLNPGIVLGKQQSEQTRKPLALTGKVFCKVDAQYSSIGVGELLTTSPTPGHAMKAVDPLKSFGAVIGKALRPWAEGQGLIPILIALQ